MCGLVSLTWALPARSDTLIDHYQRLIDEGRYEQAVKLAIVQFRPDLHCEVHIEEARATLDEAEAALTTAEAAEYLDEDAMLDAQRYLDDVRTYAEQAMIRAEEYQDAGWDDALVDDIRLLRDDVLVDQQQLLARLETLASRGKTLDALMRQDTIDASEIEALPEHLRLMAGLHLVDRGQFDRATDNVFRPLGLSNNDALKDAARASMALVEYWSRELAGDVPLEDVIRDSLDAGAGLVAADVDMPEVAAALWCLTARLARSHYEPQCNTWVRNALEAIKLPPAERPDERVLQAKVAHERLLIDRRLDDWSGTTPRGRTFTLFSEFNVLWSAAEVALMIAQDESNNAATWMDACDSIVRAIQAQRGAAVIGEDLARHVARFHLGRDDFEGWLELATAPENRDRRGTFGPDVLIETRTWMTTRIRAAFEERIARAVQAGDPEGALQLVQQCKGLIIGRTLNPATGAASVQNITDSELLSLGAGERLPRKELFVEYFVGPKDAWAFYLFAPGDEYLPLTAVPLDRPQLVAACRAAVAALQVGEQPDDAGAWLLGGRPALSSLWDQLIDIKKQNPAQHPRIVIAPDGPLCYLPLQAEALGIAPVVVYMPTAAVLVDSNFMDPNLDVELLWDLARDDLTPAPPKYRRVKGRRFLTLWRGMDLPIVTSDGAD